MSVAMAQRQPYPLCLLDRKRTLRYIVSMVETALPDSAHLIDVARTAMRNVRAVPRDPEQAAEKRRRAASKALDQWAPAIDTLADLTDSARFLGLRGPDSIRRNLFRTRADGTPAWPKADQTFGKSKAWKLRTIVIHQAESPGRGHPGAALGRVRHAQISGQDHSADG